MEHKDGTISITVETIEEFHISDSTKKLTREEKVQVIKEFFQKEYQGKFVEYNKEGESIQVLTNRDTRNNFFLNKLQGYWGRQLHNTKLDVAADGKYGALISNVQFLFSSEEGKSEQSNFHKNTLRWHYFKKPIVCDSVRLDVIIDVRENLEHNFTIHNISLRYPQKEKEKNSAISGPDLTNRPTEYYGGASSGNILSQDNKDVNIQEQDFSENTAKIPDEGMLLDKTLRDAHMKATVLEAGGDKIAYREDEMEIG